MVDILALRFDLNEGRGCQNVFREGYDGQLKFMSNFNFILTYYCLVKTAQEAMHLAHFTYVVK